MVGQPAEQLALVAAGLADATWTLSPKHEWDVAAGQAVVTTPLNQARLTLNGNPSTGDTLNILPNAQGKAKS